MSIFSDGLWSDPPLATPAPHEAAQRKRPSADEPVQVAMRPKAAGQQAPSTDQKKVRRAIGRGVRKSADITGTRKPDLDDLTDEERASEQQAAYDDENPPMRQSGARTKESTMAQPTEAQILAAMAVATPGERARLVASLDDLRAQRRLAVQDQADLDLSRQVVAAHLTPVLVHQRSNAETDWLGVVATQEQDPTIAAKTAATNWYRKVSAEVKADEEEFVIQAQGAARRASSGYGQWMAVAERAFLDHVAHLAGGESKTAGRHLANSAAYNAGFADAQEGKDKGRGASDPEYMRGYNDAAVQSWLDFVGVNKTSNDAVDPQNGQANSSLTDYQDLSPVTDDAAFDEGWATNPEPSQVNDTDEDAYRQAEEDQDEVTRPYSASKTAGDGFLTPEQQAWLSARGSKTAGLDWHPAASFPGLPSLGDSADLPNGGSVLVATGPDDGKVEAVYFTPQGALVQLLTDAGSVDHAKSLVESKVDELMAMSSLHTAARSLSEIASEIRADWKNVYFGAVPYLDAMESLDSMSDRYYEDDADSIVTYFLSNATTWRGETAKRIKDELKSMSRYGSRTAADEQTCSVCGDKIAKNPEDDGYHHDNGEKHDHEAKPGKESALKTASSDIVAVTHNDTGMMHHLADGSEWISAASGGWPTVTTLCNRTIPQGSGFAQEDWDKAVAEFRRLPGYETHVCSRCVALDSSKAASRRTANDAVDPQNGYADSSLEPVDIFTNTTPAYDEDAGLDLTEPGQGAADVADVSTPGVDGYPQPKGASRKTAISLTHVGIDPQTQNGVGTDPQGNRVQFRLSDSDRASLKSILYSDLAINFSGVDVEPDEIITASLASFRARVQASLRAEAELPKKYAPTDSGWYVLDGNAQFKPWEWSLRGDNMRAAYFGPFSSQGQAESKVEEIGGLGSVHAWDSIKGKFEVAYWNGEHFYPKEEPANYGHTGDPNWAHQSAKTADLESEQFDALSGGPVEVYRWDTGEVLATLPDPDAAWKWLFDHSVGSVNAAVEYQGMFVRDAQS